MSKVLRLHSKIDHDELYGETVYGDIAKLLGLIEDYQLWEQYRIATDDAFRLFVPSETQGLEEFALPSSPLDSEALDELVLKLGSRKSPQASWG